MIGRLKQTQGTVDRVITSLNDTRNALLQRAREAMDDGIIGDKECPFCGAPYEERNILENSILAEEDVTEISKGYGGLIRNIERHLRPVAREVDEQLMAKRFELIYNKYYDNTEDKFREITDSVLQSKKKYIKRIVCDANRGIILEKQNELKKIERRHDKLKEMYDELCDYRKAIDEGITDYKKKVVHDIEPLLHVYTAKILQQKFTIRPD